MHYDLRSAFTKTKVPDEWLVRRKPHPNFTELADERVFRAGSRSNASRSRDGRPVMAAPLSYYVA
jgi:hypothetical protein